MRFYAELELFCKKLWVKWVKSSHFSEKSVVFSTGKLAIGFDLQLQKEIFRTESWGFYSALVQNKPIIFRDEKVLLNEQVITTFEDRHSTRVHISPDRLKALIRCDKTIKIFFLHDLNKVKERS